jgi:hypothetical protein
VDSGGGFAWGALGLEPGHAVSYATSGLRTGRWYHVALTWDGLVTRGYLNGALACSTPYPATNAPVHPSIPNNAGYWRQLSLTFNNIAVGNSYSTSPDRFWKGLMDEVRIYNRAVSDAEVRALYEEAFPADPTAHIATVDFSNDPDGDQDVTQYFADETLYVTLRDVNIDPADPRFTARLMLHQPGLAGPRGTVSIVKNMEMQPDGSFTAAIPLARFHPGSVRVAIQADNRSPGYSLQRVSMITILPEP